MTKRQIKHYLRHGCRVTHELFDDKEWVKQEYKEIVSQNGTRNHEGIFWNDRDGKISWLDGWSVICDTNEELYHYNKVSTIPDDKYYYPVPPPHIKPSDILKRFQGAWPNIETKNTDPIVFDIESIPNTSLFLLGQQEVKTKRVQETCMESAKRISKAMLMARRIAENSYFGRYVPIVDIVDHVNLIKNADGKLSWRSEKFPTINFDYSFFHQQYKDIMDNAKQAPKLRRIIHSEKAREISEVNNPEAIRNKLADDLQKAITNAALAGENKVTFKCTIPNYRYFIHELLIAGGYTFSGKPCNFDDIHISWKINLENLKSPK